MRRILAAVDGSEPALRAVDFAARLASETGAELVILTATEEMLIGDKALREFARSEHLATAWGDLSEARAQEILITAHERAAAKDKLRVRTEWRTGNPKEVIARFAKDEACDLIVVGHAGRSRIVGVVLGSVAFKLVTAAPCPVTVVGPPGG